MPAPKAIKAPAITYFIRVSRDLRGKNPFMLNRVLFSLVDSLILSMINVDERLSDASKTYSMTWLSLFEKPKPSKITVTGIIRLPNPKAMLWANPYSEKALFRFFVATFSAIKAPIDAAKAASAMPSPIAAANRNVGFVVNAKTAIMALAIMFPVISIFRLPYLSAAIPRGMLALNVDTPMRVMIKPIVVSGSPWMLVRK